MKRIVIYNLIFILLFATLSYGNVVDFVVSDGYGPYKLSKSNPQNVEVSLGKKIIDPITYNVKESSIFFAKPVEIGKVIKITYTVTNLAGETTNFSFNSYKDRNDNISMVDGKYNSKLYGGDFGVNFALKNQDQTIDNNSATSLSYKKAFGKLTLGTTYTTTGENLNNVQNYKTSNDLLELLASYNENNVSLDTKYIKYEDSDRIVLDNKGSYSFKNGAKISFGYNTDNTNTLNKNTYDYSLEKKFGLLNTKAFGQNIISSDLTKYNKYGGEIGNNIFSIGMTNENKFEGNNRIKINNYKGSLNANAVNLDIYNTDTYDEKYLNEKNAKISVKNKKGNLAFATKINEEDGEVTGVTKNASGSYQIGKHTIIGGTYSNTVKGEDLYNSYEGNVKYSTNKLGMSYFYKNSKKNFDDMFKEYSTGFTFDYNTKFNWTVDYLNRELAKDNRFSKLKLTGNYKIDKLNIYALYIDRKSSSFIEDTKSAKLTYSLLKFLEISSQWTENPANKDNNDLYDNLVEYNYGLKLIFGDVSISGNAYETLDSFSYLNKQKYDFGLSAKMFGGSLSGSVLLDHAFGDTNNFYRKYSIGFSKGIKNKFTFGISGSYDERNLNKGGFKPGDIQGNMNLGVNF